MLDIKATLIEFWKENRLNEIFLSFQGNTMYAKDSTIKDRREMLRIKLKSLMEEARIIRREEMRTNGILREELARHRRGVVRDEARHTHIAYAFIRGRTFRQIETRRPQAANPIDWDRVKSMVKKYGPKGFEADFEAWKEAI